MVLVRASPSPEQRAASLGYIASQPSVIRTAIETIPEIAGAHFIDLGCGKGRAVAVATEYPYASIAGIELSPGLARRARSNMKRRSPSPSRADAGQHRPWRRDTTRRYPPKGSCVLYL